MVTERRSKVLTLETVMHWRAISRAPYMKIVKQARAEKCQTHQKVGIKLNTIKFLSTDKHQKVQCRAASRHKISRQNLNSGQIVKMTWKRPKFWYFWILDFLINGEIFYLNNNKAIGKITFTGDSELHCFVSYIYMDMMGAWASPFDGPT